MKKTGNIMHDLLNYAIGKEIKAELKTFSLQLLHRKIQFTANGYFTLDNTFLYSVRIIRIVEVCIIRQKE
ncbi:PREDICTED: putative gustatory receptor 28b [Trachymyrmex cornetzi]|uniref:putative gustatory receptor 28b n=1 Tax=Trachymyrmex cornetzi TaxID=471704 RepID=UPI00084F20AC|nr:PREDICTED: putative gustatory receptor 28b [Trachymyrmex cornetzi]